MMATKSKLNPVKEQLHANAGMEYRRVPNFMLMQAWSTEEYLTSC